MRFALCVKSSEKSEASMRQKTRLLIDRITEKEPVPEVKEGNGKQQKQYRVLSVEKNRQAADSNLAISTEQYGPRTTDNWTTDHRKQ